MRLAALWLLLAAVYAATLTIPATAEDRYAGEEPHHLLAAKSWAQDGDMDLTNQYAQRQWREFVSRPLEPSGEPVLGRLREPEGVGFALLASPAYSLGGPRAVEALIAALTALGFVLAAALARRLVPEPWASTGALLVGLSPAALAAATTVSPEPVAGTLLAGAALCALKVRRRARLRYAYGSALMLAVLPWLDAPLALAGVPVAVLPRALDARRAPPPRRARLRGAAARLARLLRADQRDALRRPAAGCGAARAAATGIGELPGRAVNLLGVWLDPVAGLLRWAPVLALAFVAGWLLWRSRREHVAAAIPERREAERTAELLLWIAGVQWLVAAFSVESADGPWFPGLPLMAAVPVLAALSAWGLRHARIAGAVLGAVTLALSAWVLADAWIGPAEGWLGVS